jgi:cobalt-zinc-cadmium efflux system protein
MVGLIYHEAYLRLFEPPAVKAGPMIAVAVMGLAVNLASMWVLKRSQAESLNVRAAFVHVMGDALGSVGAIVAGIVMWVTNWYAADPLVSVAIGLLILYSSWGIVRESADILMQGTPREICLKDIEQCLLDIPCVHQVHDLHVWTMTSGMYLLSVHLVAGREDAVRPIIEAAHNRLRERFGIGHTTVQVDPEDECAEESRLH